MKMIAKSILGALLLLPGMAQATVYQFSVSLSGANESPANASPGTGSGMLTLDDAVFTLHLDVDFSGLTGTTTAAHIHGATATPFSGTAGVATTTPNFPGFPLGVTSGTYDNTFDMTLASSYNSAFITANGGTTAGAFSALLAAANNGQAYLNIHSSTFGGGEIRGFLTALPEPGAGSLLLLLGLAGWGSSRRRSGC